MWTLYKLHDISERSPKTFWLCLALLFLVVLALHGKAIPFNNEYLYLLRLEPGFLQNDWSFSRPAAEHWLFNLVFSIPAHIFTIETIGWFGRVATWALCLAALIRLGRVWQIPYWAIAGSIGCWLAFGQSVVNAEWIFGTFEAKTVSYVCLLFALYGFAIRKILLPSALLGLAFSFHPAVGMWAIPAVGIALVLERSPVREMAKFIGVTGLFTLPGALPLLLEQSMGAAASFADWQFIVTTHMPYHFDPYYFSKLGVGLLALMLVFNLFALYRTESFALRFVRHFQVAIAAFFVLGVAMRWLELYRGLGFMPLRLFPILTPLFFIFTAFYFIPRLGGIFQKITAAIFVVLVISMLHPIDEGIGQMRETKASWVARPDDFESALAWLSQNTPSDAVVLTTPHSRKLWYLSRRAQIVSYIYPRYERMAEWRKRLADMTGGAKITDRAAARRTIDSAFERLSVDEIVTMKQNYSATHLLTPTEYPFPVIFESGSYKIYQLP